MSYSIDLEHARLFCRTNERALAAAKLINSHPWLRSRMRLSVSPSGLPQGAPQWQLIVDSFDGSYWNNQQASEAWLKLVPFLADRSCLEIRTEQGERFRYRWENGHVHHDEPVITIWREYSLLGPFQRLEQPDTLPSTPAPTTQTPHPPKSKSEARAKRRR